MENVTHTSTATAIHLSSLAQYCIPFGNFIFPLIIWSSTKDKSEFVDHSGKQVLNFQLSLLLYSIALALIAIPILIFTVFNSIPLNTIINDENVVFDNFNFSENIGLITLGVTSVFIFFCLKIAEFFLIIYASIKTSNGEKYKYPITIPFIK